MKRVALLAAFALAAATAAYADAPMDMLKAKGCLGCHDIDKKKVGPAYKDVAKKYAGDSGAEAKIAGELKEGKGHPIKVKATDEELKTLINYVLSLK